MVFLHTSLPASSSNCAEYTRIVSMKELDSSLAMLCNYGQSTYEASKAQRRQTIASCMGNLMTTTLGTTETFDASDQPRALITPPTTPDTAQSDAIHRWSASSISSISSRGSTKIQPTSPSLYSNQQFSSSVSSSFSPSEMSDKSDFTISTSSSAVYLDFVEIMRTATSTSTTGQNVVPIDNKIEQAMDLVKTHLTFAVREEVEILRSTIIELEAKVAQLESQNQVLKQFAPVEVVNSLAALVQQQQQRQLQLQQQQLSSGTTSPNPVQPVSSQNVSVSVQGTQNQSVSTMTTEISAGSALSGIVPPVGFLSEVQPVVEQKQPRQLSASASIVDSDL